ncbi:MAG: class I SAM-dependent methyltransferase [Anaerolineae bacterium]|nr:class I SAM-dependent methyltransferase [Anaerolineae bacterium]
MNQQSSLFSHHSFLTMYNKIAHYYDLTHADLTEDVDYILKLVASAGSAQVASAGSAQTVSILELGCGSGRLLLPLARAGYHVTGIDNATVMLARAQKRLTAEPEAVQQRVTLLEADMTQFNITANRFDWAILPYNTFMHLTPKQMSMALKKIAGSLGENGRLLIDLINPTAIASTTNDHLLTLENSFIDPENGHIVVQQSSSHLDENAQTLHITWLYDATPPTGGAIHRTIAQADYHYLYPHQLELLLHEAGFRLLAITGSYDNAPYTEESDRLLILAQCQP